MRSAAWWGGSKKWTRAGLLQRRRRVLQHETDMDGNGELSLYFVHEGRLRWFRAGGPRTSTWAGTAGRASYGTEVSEHHKVWGVVQYRADVREGTVLEDLVSRRRAPAPRGRSTRTRICGPRGGATSWRRRGWRSSLRWRMSWENHAVRNVARGGWVLKF